MDDPRARDEARLASWKRSTAESILLPCFSRLRTCPGQVISCWFPLAPSKQEVPWRLPPRRFVPAPKADESRGGDFAHGHGAAVRTGSSNSNYGKRVQPKGGVHPKTLSCPKRIDLFFLVGFVLATIQSLFSPAGAPPGKSSLVSLGLPPFLKPIAAPKKDGV